MAGLNHSERAELVLSLVRVLAPAAALSRTEAAAVADRALTQIAPGLSELPDRAAIIARTENSVRRAAGRGRSVLATLPAAAAERAAKGDLDLQAVFGEVEPDTAAFMLLEAAERLPARYRIPLLLSLVLGWTPSRIGGLLGATADEIETTLTGALRLFEREIRFAIGEAGS